MIHRGDILDGKYEILMLRGRGGMSKVWLAVDTHINKQWAVKEIDKHSRLYKATIDSEKTLREVEIKKKLDHPALARIVDIIDTEDSLCIIEDYIDGDNLLEIVKRGIPEQETVVSWMLDVCDAMAYFHSLDPPIIYRDLKPSNIMLTRDSQRIKIVDFGIAKSFIENTEDTQPLGTMGYASPEHSTMHTDIRSDIYTVGTTMYHLLTGVDPSKPPYVMKPIREINPDLSSGLEKIIIKATKADPSERYQTDAELANALESYRNLEQEHIDELEHKIKGFRRGIKTGAVLFLAGLIFFIASTIMVSRSYQGLTDTTPGTAQAAENYKKAIELSPTKPEAYEKLLAEYVSDGQFADSELKDFVGIYEQNKTDFSRNEKGYSEVSYKIGESILTYYAGPGDTSARARILQAEPFFTGVTKGERVNLAKNYVFMASFYREYILADSSLVVKGATKENLTELLTSCEGAVEGLQTEEFTGRDQMKAIVYEFIISVIDTKASEMHAAGIERSRIESLLAKMKDDPECTPENTSAAAAAAESVKRGYTEKNSKEVTIIDADDDN